MSFWSRVSLSSKSLKRHAFIISLHVSKIKQQNQSFAEMPKVFDKLRAWMSPKYVQIMFCSVLFCCRSNDNIVLRNGCRRITKTGTFNSQIATNIHRQKQQQHAGSSHRRFIFNCNDYTNNNDIIVALLFRRFSHKTLCSFHNLFHQLQTLQLGASLT